MNKLAKAAVASGAGLLLLLGGAGTLAYWNDSATVSGGTITAGNLEIVDNGDGEWTDQDDDVIDLSTFHAVPGDVLTYTQTLDLIVDGDNLEAEFGITDGSITAASTDPEDAALAAILNAGVGVTVTGTGVAETAPGSGVYTIPSDATTTVTVTVTITWPDDDPAVDNPAKTGEVSLADFALALLQTAPVPAGP